MGTFTIISFLDEDISWKVDTAYFVEQLNKEWPEVEVHYSDQDDNYTVLNWSFYVQGYPYGCSLMNDYQSISADTGWWEKVIPLAIWYRRIAPASLRLYMYSPEVDPLEILPGMTEQQLKEAMRGGPKVAIPEDLSQIDETQLRKYIHNLNNLHSGDGYQAVEVLVRLGEKVIPYLIEVLRKTIVGPHHGICKVLARMGTIATPYLVDTFNSSEGTIRHSITLALWHIADPESLPTLIEALADQDAGVRETAALALGELGKQAQPAVGALLENLEHSAKELKVEIVKALGNIGDPRAFEPLLALLENREEDEYVRLFAASALAKTGAQRAIDPLFEALKDADRQLTVNIFGALENICGVTEIERLSELLKDNQQYSGAIPILVKLGEAGKESLIEAFLAYPHVQFAIAEIIGKVGKPAIPILLTLVKTSLNPQTRLHAMYGLGNIKETELIQPLAILLQNPDPDIRFWAAHGLSEYQELEATEALLQALQDKEGKVRGAALLTLARNSYTEIFDTALQYAKDPSPDVRSLAMRILGDTGQEEALPILDYARKNDLEKDSWGSPVAGEASSAWQKLCATIRERLKG